MARNVNVWFTNWQRIGTSASSEFEGDFRIEWIDENGKQQRHVEKVRTEDLLKEMPEEWLMEKYFEMTLMGLRKKLGIDYDPTEVRGEEPA